MSAPADRLPAALPPASADDALAQALQRLAVSRARLQQDWLPPAPPPGSGRRPREGAVMRLLRRALRRTPQWSFALEAARLAWRRHPLAQSVESGGRQVAAVVAPSVRRHPVAWMAGAAAAGALIVAARPWHWRSVRAPASRLPRMLGVWAFGALSQAPIAEWVQAAMSAVLPRDATASPEPQAAATTPDDRSGTPEAGTLPATDPQAPGGATLH